MEQDEGNKAKPGVLLEDGSELVTVPRKSKTSKHPCFFVLIVSLQLD